MKNKIVAGILGILLGGWGIHKFYMGKVGAGILYLLFFWTGIPTIIGLIEGIMYLISDDQTFYRKYCGMKPEDIPTYEVHNEPPTNSEDDGETKNQ